MAEWIIHRGILYYSLYLCICFKVSVKIISKTMRDTYQGDHFDLTTTPDLYH